MNQVNENQRVEGTPARSIPPEAPQRSRHGLALVMSSLVVGATVVFAGIIPAQSSQTVLATPHTLASLPGSIVEAVEVPPLQSEELPAPDEKLVAYLTDAASTWVLKARSWKEWPDCAEHQKLCENYEKVEHETTDQTRARIASIARDVAIAAKVEFGAWPDEPSNARTAILVLGLGFEETLYRDYVDDGRCNSWDWQKSSEGQALVGIGGNCDGTLAHSIWQIHLGDDGILLPDYSGKGQDWRHLASKPPQRLLDEDAKRPLGLRQVVDGENILQSRLLAARTAWRIARQALRVGKFRNLCAYTGELRGVCPKGDIRLDFANNWWTRHPFPSN